MPVITLNTDFGEQDFLVGAMKGQLVSKLPSCQFVDITHQLPRSNYMQAGYMCAHAFQYYPPQSIHLVLVNFFDSSSNRFLVTKVGSQWIICPDNGILLFLVPQLEEDVYCFDYDRGLSMLEITASMLNSIQNWVIAMGHPKDFFSVCKDFISQNPLRPTSGSDWIDCHVIYVDKFENVVVNLQKEEFERVRQGRAFRIDFHKAENLTTISHNYSEVDLHSTLAWFNSAGYLEIAINGGNMAGLFGLQGYDQKKEEAIKKYIQPDAKKRDSSSGQQDYIYTKVRIFFS